MTDKITEERLALYVTDDCPLYDHHEFLLPQIDEIRAMATELQSLRSAQASQAAEVEVVAYEVTDKLTAYDFKRRSARLAGDPWIPSALLDTEGFGLEPLITLSSHLSVIAAKDAANAALMAERTNLIETKRQQLAAKDAEIERLVRERDAAIDKDWVARPAYDAAVNAARDYRTRAEARLARAVEALRPFAEASKSYDIFWHTETGGQERPNGEDAEMTTFFSLGSEVNMAPLSAYRAARQFIEGEK